LRICEIIISSTQVYFSIVVYSPPSRSVHQKPRATWLSRLSWLRLFFLQSYTQMSRIPRTTVIVFGLWVGFRIHETQGTFPFHYTLRTDFSPFSIPRSSSSHVTQSPWVVHSLSLHRLTCDHQKFRRPSPSLLHQKYNPSVYLNCALSQLRASPSRKCPCTFATMSPLRKLRTFVFSVNYSTTIASCDPFIIMVQCYSLSSYQVPLQIYRAPSPSRCLGRLNSP